MNCEQMLMNTSQGKIVVKLPYRYFYLYKELSSNIDVRSIFNPAVLFLALLNVLGELKALSIQERNECSELLWYKVLSENLSTKFCCDIESEEFNKQDCFVLAQKMMNNPITGVFKFLECRFGKAGGDES